MAYNTGLSVGRVVSASVSMSTAASTFRNFGSMLAIGSTPGVIDIVERKRNYTGSEGVASDYGVNSPEFGFAEQFFSQVPQPAELSIGFWAQSPTAGTLHGAVLTPSQRLITNFNTIVNGSVRIPVDGVPYTLSNLNFTGLTNLNGVAAVLQTALQAAGAAGATVLWNGNLFRFEVTSGTTGPSSSVNYGAVATPYSNVAFTAQPAPNATLTLGGTALTAVASNPGAGQFLIGATLAATLSNLAATINTSTDPQVSKFTAVAGATTLYLYADVVGGGSLTAVASTTPALNGTVSNSPLSGGGGTDVSVPLGLSSTPTGLGFANADAPIPGIAAESALQCAETMGDRFGDWYALAWAPVTPLADSDSVAVAGYIQGASQTRTQFLTSMNTEALDDTRDDDIGSLLSAAGLGRTAVIYSSTNPYAAASLFGRFATVNYLGSNTTITGKFKQLPGVVAEYLTETQAQTLAIKNYNVYAAYQNNTAIVQEAVMADGTFIDSRINADWLANYVQTNVYNFLLTTQTKVAQTNAGMAQIESVCAQSMQQGVVNGYLAPGQWNAQGFGTLNYQDYLPKGWYIYVPDISTQNETTRSKRIAVPIQIAGKEAGAIHSGDIAITINP